MRVMDSCDYQRRSVLYQRRTCSYEIIMIHFTSIKHNGAYHTLPVKMKQS